MKIKTLSNDEFYNVLERIQPTQPPDRPQPIQRLSAPNNMQTPTTTPEQAKKMFIMQLVNYSIQFRKYGLEHTEQCKNIETEIYSRVMGTDRGAK